MGSFHVFQTDDVSREIEWKQSPLLRSINHASTRSTRSFVRSFSLVFGILWSSRCSCCDVINSCYSCCLFLYRISLFCHFILFRIYHTRRISQRTVGSHNLLLDPDLARFRSVCHPHNPVLFELEILGSMVLRKLWSVCLGRLLNVTLRVTLRTERRAAD